MSRERVKVFVGNEIEHGIEILKIGSRTNQVSCYKGNGTRRLRLNDEIRGVHRGQHDFPDPAVDH